MIDLKVNAYRKRFTFIRTDSGGAAHAQCGYESRDATERPHILIGRSGENLSVGDFEA